MQKTSYQKGISAEQQAADYLMGKGWEILQSRYKTPHGEIDLIARCGSTIIFVEVKNRPTMIDALESITSKARQRIAQTAALFLADYHGAWDIARFDVITVVHDQCDHLENAWMVEE